MSGKSGGADEKVSRAWKCFDRRAAGPTHRQLLYLGALLAGIIAVGALVLAVCHPGDRALWHAFLYATDSGYMGQDMESMAGPSLLGVLVTLLGWVFMSGLFLTILVNGYQEHVGRIRDGKRRYVFSGGHGIVLGWNRMGVSVVGQLLRHGCGEIVILALRGAQEIRRHLQAELADFGREEHRIFILNGSFDVAQELEGLNPAEAGEIVILGDPDVRDDHAVLGGTTVCSCDSRNMEAAMHIGDIVAGGNGRRGPVRCHIHLSNLRSYGMFQRINLPRSGGGGLELRPFNFFENWAWQLWSPLAMRGQPRPFFSLTHGKPFTRENGRHVHLFIVGFGLMGQAIAAHTARIAHFANGQKTRITVIDSQLDWWRDVFRSHCFVERVPDLSLEFLALPAESDVARGRMEEAAADERCVMTVAVTLSNPDAAMATALSLPRGVLMRDIPVLVRQETFSGLSRLTELIRGTKHEDAELWDEIRFFGQLDHCAQFNEERERIARRIHDYYLRQARRNAEAAGRPFVPGKSQVPWEELPVKFRLSNMCQADMISVKVEAMGYGLVPARPERPLHVFTAGEIERLAEMEHDRWVAERTLAGWTHSAVRDDKNLLHNDLIPYAELDEPTKEYDRDAARNLPELLREGYGLDLTPLSGTERD
ncbi:MAG TPA: RyR domain-containing protein [Candidatus Hydrogenedentes bacterium]|nr:RyR domain-containing protein [Candidatus Hydrogenedentota bacterium]